MDAERGYSEERWYSDDRGYPEPDWRESRRGGGYDDDRRAPAQRGYPEPGFPGFGSPGSPAYADPGYGTQREPAYDSGFGAAPASPAGGGGLYGPRPADRPALPPQPEPNRPAAASRGADEGVYRSGGADEGVYRGRKPLHAAVLAIFLGAFELIMVLQFVKGVFGFDLHRVLSGGLTLLALPAFGIGFYALLTGAAHGGPKAFLKTPLAYLPVGLLLLVAAGAAA